MAKFLDSNKVKVFPTAFRGKDGNGNAVNPEAFMTTENNLVNLTNKVTYNHKDYFFLDGSTVHIIVGGYYFIANKSDITALFTNPSTNDEIHACISVSNLSTSYSGISVPTLTPNGGSAGDILDVTQQFKGLSFEGKDDTQGLKLFKYDGSSWNPIIASMLNIDVSQVGWGNSPISSHFLTSDLVGVNTGIGNLYGYSGPINLYSDIIPQVISGSLPQFNLGSEDNFFSSIYGRNFVLNEYRGSCYIEDVLRWEPYDSNYDLGSVFLKHLESGVESSPGGTLNLVNFGLNMNSGSIYGVSSIFASSMYASALYASALYASSISLSGQTMFVSVKNATLKTSSDIYMSASKQISLFASDLGLFASSDVSGTIYGNISIYANKNIDIVAQFSSGNTHYGSLLLSAYSTVEIRTGDQSSGKILFTGSVYAQAIHNFNDFRIDVLDPSGNTMAGLNIDEYTGTYITEKNSGRSINLSASGGMLSLYAGSSMTLSAKYSMNLSAKYSINLNASSIYINTPLNSVYFSGSKGGFNTPIYIDDNGKINSCSIYIRAGANTVSPTVVSYAAYASSGFGAATSPLSISNSEWKVFPYTLFITTSQINSIFTINVNCYQNVGGWMRFDVWYLLNACGIPYGNFNYEYFTCNISPRMNCCGSVYQPFMAWFHDTTSNYKRYIYAYESPTGSGGAGIGADGFAMTITLRANDNFYN